MRMKLHLITNATEVTIDDVMLTDGYMPTISNYQHQLGTDGIYLEPASWFKALFIETLMVDCKHGCVTWTKLLSEDHSSNRNKKENMRLSFTESELLESYQVGRDFEPRVVEYDCFGCDEDINEVIETVPALVRDHATQTISETQFFDELLKLLHCCILPNIKLIPDDIESVSGCIDIIQVPLQTINDEMRDEMLHLVEAKIMKHEQRMTLTDETNFPALCADLSPELTDVLLRDLGDDITKLWNDLEKAQDSVEKAKISLQILPNTSSEMNTQEALTRLRDSREIRDAINVKYEQTVLVRETLKDLKRRRLLNTTSSPSNLKTSDITHRYMSLHSHVRSLQKRVSTISDKKMMILSVKTAINSTLEELKKGEDTFGIKVSSVGTTKVTDVLGVWRISRPWQTLTERVAAIMEDKSHRLHTTHWAACENFVSRCDGVIYEHKLYDACSKLLQCNSTNNTDGLPSTPSFSDLTLTHSALLESFEHAGGSKSMRKVKTSTSLSQCSRRGDCSKHCRLTDYAEIFLFGTTCMKCSAKTCQDGVVKCLHNLPKKSKTESKQAAKNVLLRHFRPNLPRCKSSSVISVGASRSSLEEDEVDCVGHDTLMVFNAEKNYLQRGREKLRGDIKSHLLEMTRSLQMALGMQERSHFKKLWLAYENHFYRQVMESLLYLYEIEYVSAGCTVFETLAGMSAADVGIQAGFLLPLLRQLDGAVENMLSPSLDSGCSSFVEMKYPNESTPSSEAVSSASSSPRFYVGNSISSPDAELEYCNSPDTTCCSNSEIPSQIHQTSDSRNSEALTTSFYIQHLLSQKRTRSLRPRERSVKLKSTGRALLDSAFKSIDDALAAKCPLAKLQFFTKSLQELSKKTLNNICADDLQDGIIILICNLDRLQLARLYFQIRFLVDFTPDFTESNASGFTLTSFMCAYLHIQTRVKEALDCQREGGISDATSSTSKY